MVLIRGLQLSLAAAFYYDAHHPIGTRRLPRRLYRNFEIYMMHADGSVIANLTNNSASDFRPAWSPGVSESIAPDTTINSAVERKGDPVVSGVLTVSTSIAFTFTWTKGGGATYGAILGTVRNSTGNAISGATVTADTGQSDTTDTYGWYRLDGVPASDRTVTASAPGYAAQSQQTTVRDGGEGVGLYFTLEPDPTYAGTGTVKGKVTDATTGKNLEGVLISTD